MNNLVNAAANYVVNTNFDYSYYPGGYYPIYQYPSQVIPIAYPIIITVAPDPRIAELEERVRELERKLNGTNKTPTL